MLGLLPALPENFLIKYIDLHMPKQKRRKSVANGSDRWRRRKWCVCEIWTLIIMLTLLFFFPDPLHRILHVTLRGREGWRHAPDCAPQPSLAHIETMSNPCTKRECFRTNIYIDKFVLFLWLNLQIFSFPRSMELRIDGLVTPFFPILPTLHQ